MKIVSFLLTLGFVFLSGCSSDPYEKYVGYWERKDVEHKEVLQISRDGETYLMNDNILRETDMFGKPKKAMVLRKSEGQLSVENGLGSVMLGISEDGETLRASNREFKKITEDEVAVIQQKVAKETADFEKNKSLCEAITTEYQAASNAINQENLPLQDRTEKRKALQDATKKKAQAIPNCKPGFFW